MHPNVIEDKEGQVGCVEEKRCVRKQEDAQANFLEPTLQFPIQSGDSENSVSREKHKSWAEEMAGAFPRGIV